jgi:5,6-dimethylbenzimidazole synthase
VDLYEAIYRRRNVEQFRADAVPDEVLVRILDAAHHAGSVGFMQPWNFVVVRSREIKEQVRASFVRENVRCAVSYHGSRGALYRSLRLEGIVEAPVNLAVTCDRERSGPAVLGRRTMPETDLYSTCCAIQNLWLSARAEGVGVGWVSILEPDAVKQVLGIPDRIVLVAYLCLGFPLKESMQPALEEAGWENRVPLAELVFEDAWNQKCPRLFDAATNRTGRM